jgi:hypothetical protein
MFSQSIDEKFSPVSSPAHGNLNGQACTPIAAIGARARKPTCGLASRSWGPHSCGHAGFLDHPDERREFRQRRLPAVLIVVVRHAVRQPIIHGQDIGAASGISKRESDRHRAAQGWICRLELDHFDDLLVGFELHDAVVEGGGARGRFADSGGASEVSEIRSEPPSRASNACTWLVMPVGTIHVATACVLRSARIDDRAALSCGDCCGSSSHLHTTTTTRRPARQSSGSIAHNSVPRVGNFGLIGQTTSSRDSRQEDKPRALAKRACQKSLPKELAKRACQESLPKRVYQESCGNADRMCSASRRFRTTAGCRRWPLTD